jgi:glycine/D-amino acid oxidase-like deaminating enzyme
MSVITDQSPLLFNDSLPAQVDVVVIGAGIAGVATSYFLAQHGLKVALCEKGRVAGEQSSRSFGWIRQQGRDWAELPIMMESNRIWRRLAAETGEADLAFTESGCYYLAETEAALARYEQWCELARQHELDTHMLTAGEVRSLFPGLKGQWTGAMATSSDGRGEHFIAVPALARAARRSGVSVIENCAVRTVDTEAGRVAGVVTEKGRTRCQSAVLAAGAWSTCFAANAGVDLPQLATCSSGARTEQCAEVFSANLSLDGLSFLRRDDGSYTVSSSDRAVHHLSRASFKYFGKFFALLKLSARDVRLKLRAPPGYPGAWGSPRRWTGDEISPFEHLRVVNPKVSPTVLKRIRERMPERCPALKNVKLAEAWSGLIDVTPDAVPTLGEDPALKGLFIATGLSGHGFGIGPAIGRIVADLVRGAPPGHDLQRFRPTRFFDGSTIQPGPY